MTMNFEVIVNKKKEPNSTSPSNVKIEGVTPIIKNEDRKEFYVEKLRKLLSKYFDNEKKRQERQSKDTIIKTYNNKEINTSILRTPETEFQNALIQLVYQHDVNKDDVELWTKRLLAENNEEGSIKIKDNIGPILNGVESCIDAINYLERDLCSKYEKDKFWIATNNELDARYKIDLLSGIENKTDSIDVLYLVQVKSSESNVGINDITETHQKYLNSLPQLIGTLNKKEAASQAEKEMEMGIKTEDTEIETIDIDNHREKQEQITLFSLVLEEYISTIINLKYPRAIASDFFELFQKEGGNLDPFTFMGILKNNKLMNEYCKNERFKGDEKLYLSLIETANKIPYTEEQSIEFHRKNHVHTIIDSAKIISVIMVGGSKISEIELKHPYADKMK